MIIFYLLGIVVGFMINAGIVWLLCWTLQHLNIYHIGPLAVEFSWYLALLFTLVIMILKGLISIIKKND